MLPFAWLLFANLCFCLVTFPEYPSGPTIQIAVTLSSGAMQWLYTDGAALEILTTYTDDIQQATNFTLDLSTGALYYPVADISYKTHWGIVAVFYVTSASSLQQFTLKTTASGSDSKIPLVCTGAGATFSCAAYNAPVLDTIAPCATRYNHLDAWNAAYWNNTGPVQYCGVSPTVVGWRDVRHANASQSSSSASASASASGTKTVPRATSVAQQQTSSAVVNPLQLPSSVLVNPLASQSSSSASASASGIKTLPQATSLALQQTTSANVNSLQLPSSVLVNTLPSATSSHTSSASCSVTVLQYYTTSMVWVPVGYEETGGRGGAAGSSSAGSGSEFECRPVTSTIVG